MIITNTNTTIMTNSLSTIENLSKCGPKINPLNKRRILDDNNNSNNNLLDGVGSQGDSGDYGNLMCEFL